MEEQPELWIVKSRAIVDYMVLEPGGRLPR